MYPQAKEPNFEDCDMAARIRTNSPGFQVGVEIAEGTEITASEIPHCTLVWSDSGFASGVYLGGRIVLTAEHVVRFKLAANVSIQVASIAERRDNFIPVTEHFAVPGVQDISMLVLWKRGPDLPIVGLARKEEFLHPDLASPQIGTTVAGFGCGFPPGRPRMASCGVKRSATLRISRDFPSAKLFDAATEFVASDPDAGPPFRVVCHNDSGGPLFSNRSAQRVLVGITSRTVIPRGSLETQCGLFDNCIFTRVDVARDWIHAKAAEFGLHLPNLPLETFQSCT